MATIQVNNTAMEYFEAGKGEPVIFVHGSASDYRTWSKQVEIFSPHYRVISYSRRYHFPNEWKGDGMDYTVALHAEDLVAIIKNLELPPVNLIGSSFGAYTALETAIKYPDVVKSLVLGEPPMLPLLVSNINNPLLILKLLISDWQTGKSFVGFGKNHIEPAKKAFRKNEMAQAVRLFGTGVLGEAGFNNMSENKKAAVMQNAPALKAELLGPGFSPIPSDALKKLKIPTLLVYGEKSPLFFHSISDKLANLLPVNEKILIPSASHSMHNENAETYNRAVMAFLEKHN